MSGPVPASARISGASPRVADLAESVMVGLLLDRALGPDAPEQTRVVDDLADAVAAMA